MAAAGGLVDIMGAAIERGAGVDAVDMANRTPLHCAAFNNRVETINVLVKSGVNIEARDRFMGSTPLHDAVQESRLEAVLALLKHDADVNAHDKCQLTPLHLAAGNAGKQGAAEMVDLLLRSGADETILNNGGKAAADIVAGYVEEEEQLAEDVNRVHELLANAPADRAWRRRGYLVLCRAHPDRIQQIQDISSAQAGIARTTRSSAKMGRTEASGCSVAVEASPADGRTSGDWAVAVARVLVLQEEGIFRMIVGYV